MDVVLHVLMVAAVILLAWLNHLLWKEIGELQEYKRVMQQVLTEAKYLRESLKEINNERFQD